MGLRLALIRKLKWPIRREDLKKSLGGWRRLDLVGLKVTGGGGGWRYSCKIANWTRAGIYSRCGSLSLGKLSKKW